MPSWPTNFGLVPIVTRKNCLYIYYSYQLRQSLPTDGPNSEMNNLWWLFVSVGGTCALHTFGYLYCNKLYSISRLKFTWIFITSFMWTFMVGVIGCDNASNRAIDVLKYFECMHRKRYFCCCLCPDFLFVLRDDLRLFCFTSSFINWWFICYNFRFRTLLYRNFGIEFHHFVLH